MLAASLTLAAAALAALAVALAALHRSQRRRRGMARALAAAAAGEALLRDVLENAGEAYVAIDAGGTITYWNARAEETFGWTKEEATGRALTDTLIPGEYRLAHMAGLARHLKTGEGPVLGNRVELAALTRDGRQIPVELVIWANDCSAEPTFHAFLQDVSARKAAASELEAANASLQQQADELLRSNAELEQFAYVASHDLSEPLRMVSSYVQLLQRRYGGQLGPDADEFIGFAVAGVARMRCLIDDLLAYSRVGRLEDGPKVVDTGVVVADALSALRAAIGERGATVAVDPLPTCLGREGELRQVFQNLISNAVKFSGDEAPQVRVTAAQEPLGWRFTVRDNGIGIDAEHHDQIFKVFQRLHSRERYAGTGIGLAICRKIVERHGGRIWVESAEGEGATFAFTLPAAPTA